MFANECIHATYFRIVAFDSDYCTHFYWILCTQSFDTANIYVNVSIKSRFYAFQTIELRSHGLLNHLTCVITPKDVLNWLFTICSNQIWSRNFSSSMKSDQLIGSSKRAFRAQITWPTISKRWIFCEFDFFDEMLNILGNLIFSMGFWWFPLETFVLGIPWTDQIFRNRKFVGIISFCKFAQLTKNWDSKC